MARVFVKDPRVVLVVMTKLVVALGVLGLSAVSASDDPLACQPNDEFPMLCVPSSERPR